MTGGARVPSTQVVLGALRVLVAGVIVARSAALLGGRPILTGRGERRFFGWAYREPALQARLSRAAVGARYGEAICMRDPAGAVDPGWLRMIAIYYFPEQITLVAGRSNGPPCRRTALTLRPDGLAWTRARVAAR